MNYNFIELIKPSHDLDLLHYSFSELKTILKRRMNIYQALNFFSFTDKDIEEAIESKIGKKVTLMAQITFDRDHNFMYFSIACYDKEYPRIMLARGTQIDEDGDTLIGVNLNKVNETFRYLFRNFTYDYPSFFIFPFYSFPNWIKYLYYCCNLTLDDYFNIIISIEKEKLERECELIRENNLKLQTHK